MDYSKDLRPTEQGSGVSLRSSNPETLMSALRHKRTFSEVCATSAITSKADICHPEVRGLMVLSESLPATLLIPSAKSGHPNPADPSEKETAHVRYSEACGAG